MPLLTTVTSQSILFHVHSIYLLQFLTYLHHEEIDSLDSYHPNLSHINVNQRSRADYQVALAHTIPNLCHQSSGIDDREEKGSASQQGCLKERP